MSNIYIQEPPTNGKVLLKTSLGDIDIELWTKEAPKACRNFIQLCLESYYDNTIFHRVVKGFIAQGGDPTGTGFGGESIYGEPFKDEFHSRIKFNRRGLVAMANAGKDDNGSQFFFTLAPTPELQGKHTIFGKVTGKTIYNMIKFEELDVDKNDKPANPPKIIRTEILSNPFDDILPRDLGRKRKSEDEKNEKQSSAAAKKDFKLLSFGDEAEEEEELVSQVTSKGSKSSHDLTDDPNLSSVPAVEPSSSSKRSSELEKEKNKKKKKSHHSSETESESSSKETNKEKEKESESTSEDSNVKKVSKEKEKVDEKQEASQSSKLDEVRNEYKKLKNEMLEERRKQLDKKLGKEQSEKEESSAWTEYLNEKKKYEEAKAKQPKKRSSERDAQMFAMLEKLSSSAPEGSVFSHKLISNKEEEGPVLAKDANMRGEGEWYDLYDPRNKIAQRRAAHGGSK